VVSLQFILLCLVRIDLANREHLVSHWGRGETRQNAPGAGPLPHLLVM
jgi:hypothetical protein